jgi:hypothetical protein
MSSNSNDFSETWGVVWEVKKTIPGAIQYVIENTDQKFSSGRPKIDVVFLNGNNREICRRSGMRLVSKAGREYEVCRREPETAAAQAPHQHKDSTEDVYD